LLHPHFLFRLFLVACTACLFCSPLKAQEKSTYGFNLGYEFGVPLDISRDSGQVNPLESAVTGTSQNHTGWLGARYSIPQIAEDIHLRLGLDYGLSIGRFVSDSYFDNVDVLFGGIGVPENEKVAEKRFVVQSSNHLLTPSINFDWQPGSSWRLGLGIWSTIRIGGSATREEEIIDPIETKRYGSTSTRTRDLFPGSPVSFTYFRFGPSISSSWRMSAGKNLEFRPEIFGKLDVASADALGLRAFSGGIRFNFILDPEIPRGNREIVDGNRDDREISEAPKLTADVRITSNGVSLDEAITAEPRSILHRSFETLLPFIEIPTVTDRQRVERLIDILGKRLNELPVNLGLAPTAQDPTLPEAARELASSITAATAASRAENGAQHAAPVSIAVQQPVKLRNITSSGLSISADQPSVLRPLADQWIDSRYQLPPITIERFTDSRAGLRSWNVIVRQGQRTLARYSNLEGSTAELESGLVLTSDRSSSIAPLYAEMTATDLAGQVVTVFDTLQIRKGQADPSRADSTVYEFLFYHAPGTGSLGEQLNTSNKLLLKTLKDQIGSAKNLEIHYGPRSQKYASEIFNEISGLQLDEADGPEIRLKASREVAAPSGIMAVRVLLAY
jgi:hypothetical protein